MSHSTYFRRGSPQWTARKTKLQFRSRKGVEARARKRMESPAPDYPLIDFDTAAHEWRFDEHAVLLFPTRRKNQFRVFIDGCLWWNRIGKTRLLRELSAGRML